jgi:acetyl-CoA C-acetyltransferase
MKEGLGTYKSPGLEEKYPGIMFSQFMGAEMIVKKHGFTKDDLDAFALESHLRAKARPKPAISSDEIVRARDRNARRHGKTHRLMKASVSTPRWKALPASSCCRKAVRITAASEFQICDGASAALIVSEQALKDHGLTPRARIHTFR